MTKDFAAAPNRFVLVHVHVHVPVPVLVLVLVLVHVLTAVAQNPDAASFVDPFIGTGAHGHTFPGATMPFGMVQCSPDAGKSGWDWCSGYHASDSAVIGFSHTHLSGTGCADLGDILLLPTTTSNALDCRWRSPYDHANEEASPGYYRVLLADRIEVELGATRRCGVQRYGYPESDSVMVILDLGYGQDDKPTESRITFVNDTLITGFRYSSGWAARQRVYFAMAFSRPLKSWRVHYGAWQRAPGGADRGWQEPSGSVETKAVLAALHFGSTDEGKELLIRTGLSSVSEDGALANLRAEAPHGDFERYRREAREAWNRELSRIRIDARSEADRRSFMTALYHTMIAPNLYCDVDGRYRGGDDSVHTAQGFEHATVFSLWDTYRALHPLFTIIDPDRVSDWVQSMLAFQRETGLLPVWTLHANETNCMIGYHAVPVIADAILKGIGGFSAEEGLEAMKSNAEQDKGGLRWYNQEEKRTLDSVEEENYKPVHLLWKQRPDWLRSRVLNGFASKVSGQEIVYHSAVPNVNTALLCRASEVPMPIEWYTEKMPTYQNYIDVPLTYAFTWPAGMSTGKGGHRFTLTVNGSRQISFSTPQNSDTMVVLADEPGISLRFLASMVDEFGDLFGTMILTVDVNARTSDRIPPLQQRPLLSYGEPVHLRLEGEAAGSPDWVMTFMHSFRPMYCSVSDDYGTTEENGIRYQFVRLQCESLLPPWPATVLVDGERSTRIPMLPGFNSFSIPIRLEGATNNRNLSLVLDLGAAQVIDTSSLCRRVRYRTEFIPRPPARTCYIPADVENESVSKTLEYAYDDWCIAEVAKKLGRSDDAERYSARARYYRELFDADLGFMRGRNLDGSFRAPFNPRFSTLKQHEYTEGNAWQYSWYVPHDVDGLIELHSGREPFARKLDSLFEQSSDLEGTGATSDVSGLIGLYAHGNEPSHHIAYLYNHAGQPWKTQRLARRIMREMYHDRRDGLAGNEDCGQMSAWYVLSAMGFYPLNPCGGEYEIGSPALDRAEIRLDGGRVFVIAAENNSEENLYVQSATLNGHPLERPELRHEDIMRGGELRLVMGSQPSRLWTEE